MNGSGDVTKFSRSNACNTAFSVAIGAATFGFLIAFGTIAGEALTAASLVNVQLADTSSGHAAADGQSDPVAAANARIEVLLPFVKSPRGD